MTTPNKKTLLKQLERQRNAAKGQAGVDVPIILEAAYFKDLNALVKTMNKATAKVLLPALKTWSEESIGKDTLPSDLSVLSSGLQNQFADIHAMSLKISEDMVKRGNKFNRNAFVRNINKVTGVDVKDILKDEGIKNTLEKAVKKNVELIESIPKDHYARINNAVLQGTESGKDYFSIKKDIAKIEGITKRRAKLIARDQVSKLNGNLNKARQEQIGVTHYFWRTSEDERVRPTHEENNGDRFAWDSSPVTGHPGEDVQCRCTADPDLSGMLTNKQLAS